MGNSFECFKLSILYRLGANIQTIHHLYFLGRETRLWVRFCTKNFRLKNYAYNPWDMHPTYPRWTFVPQGIFLLEHWCPVGLRPKLADHPRPRLFTSIWRLPHMKELRPLLFAYESRSKFLLLLYTTIV